MIRELQPNIIINDRLDLLDVPGGWDFRTPEQFMPREWVTMNGQKVPWETCQTFSGTWGYHRDEATWKSVRQLVTMLIEVVSKGGNLLLNVGPTARGTFDDRALDRLKGIGNWMSLHGRSIYGCTQAPAEFPKPPNCLLTYNPATKRLYVHVLEWPMGTWSSTASAARSNTPSSSTTPRRSVSRRRAETSVSCPARAERKRRIRSSSGCRSRSPPSIRSSSCS